MSTSEELWERSFAILLSMIYLPSQFLAGLGTPITGQIYVIMNSMWADKNQSRDCKQLCCNDAWPEQRAPLKHFLIHVHPTWILHQLALPCSRLAWGVYPNQSGQETQASSRYLDDLAEKLLGRLLPAYYSANSTCTIHMYVVLMIVLATRTCMHIFTVGTLAKFNIFIQLYN